MFKYVYTFLIYHIVHASVGFFPEHDFEQYACCFTPEDKLGQCIVIQQCTELNERLLHQPTTQDFDYIKKSTCGYEGKNPKVCCPLAGELQSKLIPNEEQCGLMFSSKIIGGQRTVLGEYPWMALLEYEKPTGRGFHCGGTLINNRYIITAAHCILNIPKSWKLISVRLGEHNLETDPDCEKEFGGRMNCNKSPVDITIEEQIAHEGYDLSDKNHIHDIGLLRLSTNVTYSDSIAPVCLPITSELLTMSYVGLNMTVSGWGRTENSSRSNVKLKLDVPIKTMSDCSDVYKKSNIDLGDGQFCAGGDKGKDSCTGDSGGPLMMVQNYKNDVNHYIAGIVSFGPVLCGSEGWPGIYTRVTNYIPWIINNVKP